LQARVLVRDAEPVECAYGCRNVLRIDPPLQQEGVGRHDAAGRRAARITHVLVVPGVRVLAADALQVRADAARAEQEGPVIDQLARTRPLAVAQQLRAHRSYHLRVAEVAALTDVDVATGNLERRVRCNALERLRARPDREHRDDLGNAADRDHNRREHREERGAPFQQATVPVFPVLLLVIRPHRPPHAAAAATATRSRRAARTVRTKLTVIMIAPTRYIAPPRTRSQ